MAFFFSFFSFFFLRRSASAMVSAEHELAQSIMCRLPAEAIRPKLCVCVQSLLEGCRGARRGCWRDWDLRLVLYQVNGAQRGNKRNM